MAEILLVVAMVLALIAAVLDPYAAPYWRWPHLGWLALFFYFLALVLGSSYGLTHR